MNEDISCFLRTLPNRGASATENVERHQEAGRNSRNALDAECERVAKVRLKHDIDALEVLSDAASDAAMHALGHAVATVPTALAGIRLDLLGEESDSGLGDWHGHDEQMAKAEGC